MIASFASKKTERLWQRQRDHGLPPTLSAWRCESSRNCIARDALLDLRVPPGNRLEALKGGRAGQYSIRINDRWRVCFRWRGEDAHDVKIVDYH